MKDEDYPILFRRSDAASINAQRTHFRLVKFRVILLLLISAAAVGLASFPLVLSVLAPAIIILLVVLMSISGFLEREGFDAVWFRSRAVSEAVKAETWRFMTKADPYQDSLSDADVELLFVDRLKEILNQQKSVSHEFVEEPSKGPQITVHMKKMRTNDVLRRRDYYFTDRVADQENWYSRKAIMNRRRQTRWSAIKWILEILALVSVTALLAFGPSIPNLVGVFTTLSGTSLYWSQAKSYGELAKSYGLVAQQLSLLEATKDSITTEGALSGIVTEAEGIISREHSLWLAKRL